MEHQSSPTVDLELSLGIGGYKQRNQMIESDNESDDGFGSISLWGHKVDYKAFKKAKSKLNSQGKEASSTHKTPVSLDNLRAKSKLKSQRKQVSSTHKTPVSLDYLGFGVQTETETDTEGTISTESTSSRSCKRQKQQGCWQREMEERKSYSYSSNLSQDSPTPVEQQSPLAAIPLQAIPFHVNLEPRRKIQKRKRDNIVDIRGVDKFTIKKELEPSDVGSLSRLLLPKDLVKRYILPVLTGEQLEQVKSKDGMKVLTENRDRNTKHVLTFRLVPSTNCYVLNGNWKSEFVNVIPLQMGDVIGLYWERSYFVFRHLWKALPHPQPQLYLPAPPAVVIDRDT